MAELIGANAYIIWCYPAFTTNSCSFAAGSTVISTDFRAFAVNDEVGEVDKSAGADTRRTYIKTLKDGQITTSYLHDGGTVNWGILAPGAVNGTLIWGEAGTANGAPKHTLPCFVKSNNMDQPYDGMEIFNPVFRPTADRTDGTWVGGY
jgi:hypothetical protein